MHRRTTRALPAINLALRTFVHRRDPGEAIAAILRRHRIDAHADPDFIRDMRHLLRQVAAVPDLSPLGWFSFYSDIETRLRNRDRVRRLTAAHPEIEAEEIRAPIIVVGLPRTATTLTHHILAAADGARGPQLWEWMHTDLPLGDRERRAAIRGVDAGMRMVAAVAPAMRDIHPQHAERPDECAFFLPHTEGHLARAPMPEYEQWLKRRDFTADYAYLKQGLQVLQHRRPKARWILKCPTHLGHLKTLIDLFPNAMIVWTHRDPITVVPSICSLVETSRAMHLRRIDNDARADIGRMALDTMPDLVDRARTARTRIPPAQIIDLPYPVLTANPIDTVQELYGRLGLRWRTEDEQRVAAVAHRGPGRRHEYALSEYGINESDVEQGFGDYGQLANAPAIR
jgi:hypothetical protein